MRNPHMESLEIQVPESDEASAPRLAGLSLPRIPGGPFAPMDRIPNPC